MEQYFQDTKENNFQYKILHSIELYIQCEERIMSISVMQESKNITHKDFAWKF